MNDFCVIDCEDMPVEALECLGGPLEAHSGLTVECMLQDMDAIRSNLPDW